MKSKLLLLLLALPAALIAAGSSKNCGCTCCRGKEACCCHASDDDTPNKFADAKRYPLKGVIIDLLPDRSELLVKHEAIPGFMRAMTMIFKVDAATLKAAAKGQVITATLVQREGAFSLEDVKPATAK